VIHGYQATKDLMWLDDKMWTCNDMVVDIMGAHGTGWGTYIEKQIMALNGPDHARVRGSVAQAFTPRQINRQRGRMQEVVAELCQEWAPKKKFDFTEFASYFPIVITYAVVGASTESIPALREAMEALGLQFSLDKSMLPLFEKSYQAIAKFTDEWVREREKNGGGDPEDTLNSLLAAKKAGTISHDDLVYMLVFIFLAGYDTSKTVISFIMHAMLTRPEMWERCAKDKAYCAKVVEETFRFSTVASPPRKVVVPFEYDGVKFEKDDFLIFALPLAGRDPAMFPDPMKFDPDRERNAQNRHVAFGRGAHMCLGQHLAKVQIEEGIHVIAQYFKNPKLAGEITWRPFTGVWGIWALPIEVTPGAPVPERVAAE
jgi:cytochrome P450